MQGGNNGQSLFDSRRLQAEEVDYALLEAFFTNALQLLCLIKSSQLRKQHRPMA